jgi:hypothetical protein
MFSSRSVDLDPGGAPTLVAKGPCEVVCTVYQNNSAGAGPQVVVFAAAGDVPGLLGLPPGSVIGATAGGLSQSLSFKLKNNDKLYAWRGTIINGTVSILETR